MVMVGGLSTRTGLARRGLGWCARAAVLAMALAGAASAAVVWDEEHAADHDCAACQLQLAAEPSGPLPIGSPDAPKPLAQAAPTGYAASRHSCRLPARAPPA